MRPTRFWQGKVDFGTNLGISASEHMVFVYTTSWPRGSCLHNQLTSFIVWRNVELKHRRRNFSYLWCRRCLLGICIWTMVLYSTVMSYFPHDTLCSFRYNWYKTVSVNMLQNHVNYMFLICDIYAYISHAQRFFTVSLHTVSSETLHILKEKWIACIRTVFYRMTKNVQIYK